MTKYPPFQISENMAKKVNAIPGDPGVYQFLDDQGKIIYVGKAKNLKKRVTSYFQKNHDHAKTAVMVRRIRDIRVIVVDTEKEALLLENNLIKQHQPRYNVLMKDDKTFPWICVKNEPFPRVFTTRKVVHDGSRYYGPYTSGRIWKQLVDLIRSLYKIRTCRLNLTPENIKNGKFKVCLEYHLGNCLGPCVGYQDEIDYLDQVNQIEGILKGSTQSVIREMKTSMKQFASEYRFEKAAEIKDRIDLLERFQAKSTVVNPKIKHVDVLTVVSDQQAGYVNFLKIVQGALVQAHALELKKRLDESDTELLEIVLVELRERQTSTAPEILVPFPLTLDLPDIRITVPQRGDKKALIDLSKRNARQFKMERQKQQMKQMPATRALRKMEQLQKDLRMKELPVHIECFDNSNIQGTEPVAACVVFTQGVPNKKEYRHFNIRSVTAPNDYASMEEVVFRRYRRLLDEDKPLPQLVIVDGGKGQLNAAMKSLEKLNLRNRVALIGIAKRLEEIYFPEDPVPLYLDKNSESLKIIQQLRNEAHRFGITHHRGRREKKLTHSILDEIPGIGEKTRDKMLNHFGDVKTITQATIKELAVLIGQAKAESVYHFIRKKQSEQ